MTCLEAGRIAELATTGGVEPHTTTCLTCRRAIDAQRAIRALAQRLPVPALVADRRREMAAELLAIAERASPLPASRRPMRGLGAAAAAAALAIGWLAAVHAPGALRPDVALATHERVDVPLRSVASLDVPAPLPAAQIGARDARIVQRVERGRDVVALLDGTLAIDARGTRSVDVQIGDMRVVVEDAHVRIRARGGLIASVQVFAGSAKLAGPQTRLTLERDTVWTAEPTAKQRELGAFADAWLALRDGRDREAIALFDRARDASVVEEATYWAAVAAQRAGDTADARARFAAFVETFPASPYGARARAALSGL